MLSETEQLQIVKDLPPTEGRKIPNEMESLEIQICFLACMDLDQGESTFENTSEKTRKSMAKSIIPHSAEAIIPELKNSSLKNSRRKSIKIIIYTDIGRDIDNAVLLIILFYLHKIRVVEIIFIVANVHPAEQRALATKFLTEKRGVPEVPVAYGTKGTMRSSTCIVRITKGSA